MKIHIICCSLLVSLFSSCFFFEDISYNNEGYRDGSNSGALINKGSLIGSWEKTYRWSYGGGERTSSWYPTNINSSDNYIFLEDGTFTTTNNYTYNCPGTSGRYTIQGSKIKLNYICATEPETIKEVVIDEFFFRENYIVFIQGEGYNNISKFELVK